MCERPTINPNPDAGSFEQTKIDDHVSVNTITHRYEVGPRFGPTEKTGTNVKRIEAKTNEWFSRFGGV